MASNTKLTALKKVMLKSYKKSMPKNMAFATYGRFTVLVRVMSNCVLVSTALASPDEKKIRPKVGEFHAMSRMNNGYYVAMPKPDLCVYSTEAETLAGHFAELLN